MSDQSDTSKDSVANVQNLPLKTITYLKTGSNAALSAQRMIAADARQMVLTETYTTENSKK